MTDQQDARTAEDDRIVVWGSRMSGGHTWTAREDRAIRTLARAVVFTGINLLRDSGWEAEFESVTLAPHDWIAIEDEITRILDEHRAEISDAIAEALAVLTPRAESDRA